MAASSLEHKLQMKPESRVLVLDAPSGYLERLDAVAETEPREDGAYDVVQVFVKDRLDVERRAAAALRALRPGGALWFAYPKRSSGVATDLTRDRGWDVVAHAGLRPVAQVAVDEVWSALRFRPTEDVRPRPR